MTENLDSRCFSIRKTGLTDGCLINYRAIRKLIQLGEIHRQILDGMRGIVKATFRKTPNQRHLSAFETRANGATRAGALSLTTATRGLAVAAGLTLAESFSAMLGTWPGFEIV